MYFSLFSKTIAGGKDMLFPALIAPVGIILPTGQKIKGAARRQHPDNCTRMSFRKLILRISP